LSKNAQVTLLHFAKTQPAQQRRSSLWLRLLDAHA